MVPWGVAVLAVFLICLCFFTTLTHGEDPGLAATTALEWRMFGGTPQRTHLSAERSLKNPILEWSHVASGHIEASPAVLDVDGISTVYISCEGGHVGDDGYLYALNAATGREIWSHTLKGGSVSSPAVSGGIAFCGSKVGGLYAIKSDGSLLWQFNPGGSLAVKGSPVVYGPKGEETVYFGGSDGKFYALETVNGTERWHYESHKKIENSPAVSADGDEVVFVAANGTTNYVYAFDHKGQMQWSHPIGDGDDFSSPAIDVNGTVYVGGSDKTFYAIHRNGSYKWHHDVGELILSSPAISPSGDVYFGSNHHLIALDSDGHMRWNHSLGGKSSEQFVWSTPAVTKDGVVMVGSYADGKLYAFHADGEKKWDFSTEGKVVASPVVDHRGMVYIGSWDKTIYALSETLECPKNCSNLGACNHVTGACDCLEGVGGSSCEHCKNGYDGYPSCYPVINCPGEPQCNDHGTCNNRIGQCFCQEGYTGDDCGKCSPKYEGYPHCALSCPLNCTGNGVCDHDFGTCVCNTGYAGEACGDCAVGFKPLTTGTLKCYQALSCPSDCSGHGACDDRSGECACEQGFQGEGCDTCAEGHVEYPDCYRFHDCVFNCSSHGVCDHRTGSCNCTTGFNPVHDCGTCDAGYADYPLCFKIMECPEDCHKRGFCVRSTGVCVCNTGFAGENCGVCDVGYRGDDCYKPIVCPDECSGHGTCDDRSGMCQCETGYSGAICHQCESEFIEYPYCYSGKICNSYCLSTGGTCDFETGECVCNIGYTGKDCRECATGYRKDGEVCVAPLSLAVYLGVSLVAVFSLLACCAWMVRRHLAEKAARKRKQEGFADTNILFPTGNGPSDGPFDVWSPTKNHNRPSPHSPRDLPIGAQVVDGTRSPLTLFPTFDAPNLSSSAISSSKNHSPARRQVEADVVGHDVVGHGSVQNFPSFQAEATLIGGSPQRKVRVADEPPPSAHSLPPSPDVDYRPDGDVDDRPQSARGWRFFAVRNGRDGSGVYDTWEKCRQQVLNYPGASFQHFDTATAALQYIRGVGGTTPSPAPVSRG